MILLSEKVIFCIVQFESQSIKYQITKFQFNKVPWLRQVRKKLPIFSTKKRLRS